jgi:hypothetical protein
MIQCIVWCMYVGCLCPHKKCVHNFVCRVSEIGRICTWSPIDGWSFHVFFANATINRWRNAPLYSYIFSTVRWIQTLWSFPIVSLNVSSLPYFALQHPNRVCMCYLGKWSNIWSNFSQNLSFGLQLTFTVGAFTVNARSHLQPLITICNILSLTRSTLLTANIVLWCIKNPVHKI